MLSPEHDALRFTINSPGWTLFLRKSGERQKEMMAKLLDPAKRRGETMPDDYIRGFIQGLIWAATWPRQEVEEAERVDKEEKEAVVNSTQYNHIAEYGRTLGIDSPGEEILSG